MGYAHILQVILLTTTAFAYPKEYKEYERNKSKFGTGKGAVVSNGLECAKIGAEVLKDQGSAVDAAIAVLFCEGVTGPQSMGVGGGFLATIYTRNTGEMITLNSREAAPANSSQEMFVGVKGSITGGHASAIPSEMKGYYELHQKYGHLPWSRLVKPTIDLCNNGHKVDKFLALILEKYGDRILKEPTLKEIFADKNGQLYKLGDIIRRPKLAETLETIATEGVSAFYGKTDENGNFVAGKVGKKFIEDVQSLGGVLTLEDLFNYKVKWNKTVSIPLNDKYTLHSITVPGSGFILSHILNIVKDILSGNESEDMHKIVEGFKHAYAMRTKLSDDAFDGNVLNLLRQMQDPVFIKTIKGQISDSTTSNSTEFYGAEHAGEPIDHGTSNLAVIAPNGDAITVTSTINNVFGAFKRSIQTGIILNDEMDDFSTPNVINSYGYAPSESNYIRPGKRPMSSMSPSIILDNSGNVRLLIGAAGGSQITSSVALTIIRHLIYEKSLNESINTPRFHHQLLPMWVQVEPNFNSELFNHFLTRGHGVKNVTTPVGFSAVTGISVMKDDIYPVFDGRRGGSVAIYDNKSKNIKEIRSST